MISYKKTNRSLHEKCPNTEFFLVRIFPHSDWIRTRKNSVFGHFSRSEIVPRVLRLDRQTLRVDKRALRVDRRVLRVDRRVLRVVKRILRVGEEFYERPGKQYHNNEYYREYLSVHVDFTMCYKFMKKLISFFVNWWYICLSN